MSKIQYFYMVSAILAFLVCAWASFLKYYEPLPALENLMKTTGEVQSVQFAERKGKYAIHKYPLVTLVGNKRGFEYPHWFPDSGRVFNNLGAGDHVTIWSDGDRNNCIWQLKKNNDLLVAYPAIEKFHKSDKRLFFVFGFVFIFLALLVPIGFAIYRTLCNGKLNSADKIDNNEA